MSLSASELLTAAVFAGVALITVAPRIDDPAGEKALWAALVPLLVVLVVLVVLVQASAYWLLARGWVEWRPMPVALAGLYRGFRVADVILLVAGLVGVLVWLPGSLGMTVLLVVATWLLAVVEYVTTSWPGSPTRRAAPLVQDGRPVAHPRLVQDLRRARAQAQPPPSSPWLKG